jgi:hypothetical protein
MKQITSKMFVVAIFGFTMSLATSMNTATAKTISDNSHASSLVSPSQSQKFASTPNLTATCRGEEPPCILRPDAYQSGNNLVFEWGGSGNVYNVRYPVNGGVKQVENRSGKFTFKNVQPNRVYKISVQACVTRFLSNSACTNWKTTSFTTQ